MFIQSIRYHSHSLYHILYHLYHHHLYYMSDSLYYIHRHSLYIIILSAIFGYYLLAIIMERSVCRKQTKESYIKSRLHYRCHMTIDWDPIDKCPHHNNNPLLSESRANESCTLIPTGLTKTSYAYHSNRIMEFTNTQYRCSLVQKLPFWAFSGSATQCKKKDGYEDTACVLIDGMPALAWNSNIGTMFPVFTGFMANCELNKKSSTPGIIFCV